MIRAKRKFNFNISLTVLNHLGRNLYRNFITILGESISNSWDADAKNVWIELDYENSNLTISDDGVGMTVGDFQNKFLKIGYSKRKNGRLSGLGRPYIGAKGIGKLALLSCAKKVTIVSKTVNSELIGGVIDNSELDNAIKDDLIPSEYVLEDWNRSLVDSETFKNGQGTKLFFEGLDTSNRSRLNQIKKLIALSFQFSVGNLDGGDNFNIHVNGERITIEDLHKLSQNTQFYWSINNFSDEFTNSFHNAEHFALDSKLNIKGFIASVFKPSHAKIIGTGEKVSVDLFVNGRIREKNILRHIPTQRLTESYLYGQIHFDDIDISTDHDPFTSSREGVIESNGKFNALLTELRRRIISKILYDWDKKRIELNQEGDSENTSVASKKERAGKTFVNESIKEFKLDKDDANQDKVDQWISDLEDDANFNLSSYVNCFLAENLCRNYMEDQRVSLSEESYARATEFQDRENWNRKRLKFPIRQKSGDIYYLNMIDLVNCIKNSDKNRFTRTIENSSKDYHPLRNALCHTGLLSPEAKAHLNMTFEVIKHNVKKLLSDK